MAILSILTGEKNPILRRKAAKVRKVTKAISKLIRDMQDTVKEEEGAGLAAPQVGESLAFCLAMLSGKMTVLINPEIITHSRETATEEEGCLSLPGVVIPVARFLSVTIRYLDEEGKEQERRLMGMDARVAQHEIDHLEGRLIVDDLKLPIATDRSTLGSRHATVI